MNYSNYANRIPVTAQFAYDNLCDETTYMFSQESDECGLDPWIEIQGMDALIDDPKLILWYGQVGEKIVDPDFMVYVSVQTLNRLGHQDIVAAAKARNQDR